MHGGKDERRETNRRKNGRGATPATVAVALIVLVGVVGAVNYVVLNAIGVHTTPGTTTSNTTSSCRPVSAPQCGGHGSTSDTNLIQLAPLAHAG